ncbi:type IV toxin-antitoxin system AbiEi family antitoxin domain-containing protein [Streptomyces sp. NPDC002994]|uniref:type IV toxin-antitoxin system AbiEi family antitoxin domain-containing protein n=1 Tax=Streptomyces sp. NPDC002994 TaxID=3154441 RepID=UPI0033B15EAF
MTRTTGELVSLTALAKRQRGVLLTRQAIDLGWTPSRLNRLLRRDGWTQVRRGSWAEPGLAVDRMVRLRAIQLAHPRLVASHGTAAWLHEIELPWTTTAGEPGLEFTAPAPASTSLALPPRDRVHRASLAVDATAYVAGIRVTTVTRTLADLLRSSPREEALVAVESAVSIRPLRADPRAHRPAFTHLGAVATALESGPRRGVRMGRASLRLADRRSGSPAETVARLRIHDAGLHPEPQAHVRPPGGRRLSVDFLFRAEGVAVEIEGYAYHGDRAAHDRDVRRFNELTLCERIRRSLRFTAIDVYRRPDAMIEEIRRALALARG